MLKTLREKIHPNFTTIMSILMFGIMMLFYQLSAYMVRESIKNIEKDLNHKLYYLESYVGEKFSDINYIMLNLSNSLSKEFIYSNKKVVDELLSYLCNRSGYNLSIPFVPAHLVNNNMQFVNGSASQYNLNKSLPQQPPEYFKEITNIPFKLYIGEIIYGSLLRNLIVPLGILITDDEKKQIGILWSAILIDNFNERLTSLYARNQDLGNVRLRNIKEQDAENSYAFNKVQDIFSFDLVLEILNQHHSIFIYKELKNYPFVIELEVKPEYFKKSLGELILFCVSSFVLFVVFIYCMYLLNKHRFKAPFLETYNKLHFMNKYSKELPQNSISSPLLYDFHPREFVKDIDDLISKYYLLQQSAGNPLETSIKQRVLDLVLTERHFLLSSNRRKISEDKLYLNKLIKIIDEEYISCSLEEFLSLITNYCCEFYHEAQFKMMVSPKDNKNFSFKNSALNETIFNIITFIIRGNFNICDNAIIIKGSFDKANDFPLISVEAIIANEPSATLGWHSGPSYVYSGLLSVHLLAKENNLLFDIKRKEDKMIFILEPLNKKIQFYNQAFKNKDLIKNI